MAINSAGIHACINCTEMWGRHLFFSEFLFPIALLGCEWKQSRLFSWEKKIRVLATTIIHWAAKLAWLWARHSCSSRVVQWSASPRHSWPLWLLDHDKGNSERHTPLLYYCSYEAFNGLYLFPHPRPTPDSDSNLFLYPQPSLTFPLRADPILFVCQDESLQTVL